MDTSNKPENPTMPLVLGLVACFLFAIAIIVAGYFHGNMHLETVLTVSYTHLTLPTTEAV